MATITIHLDQHSTTEMPVTPDLVEATQDIIKMEQEYGDQAYDLAGDTYHELWIAQRCLVHDWLQEQGLVGDDWEFDLHNDYLDLDWDLRKILGFALVDQ